MHPERMTKGKLLCVCAVLALLCCRAALAKAADYETDEYTGARYSARKKVEVSNGHIKLRLRGDKGTFGLYSAGKERGTRALLYAADSFSSSYFSLRVGRKEYRLNSSGGIVCEARYTETGAQLVYLIPRKAYFAVDFAFASEDAPEALQDVVRVSLRTINLSDGAQAFTIKGVFDTMLGESSGLHFSTAAAPRQNAQRQFRSMENDRWIRSADRKVGVQFLLDGADISRPGAVTLAALATLSKGWVPEVSDGTAFTAARAYNDSAVAVNWRTAYLSSFQSDVKVFYISVADGTKTDFAGGELLAVLERGRGAFPGASEAVPVAAELSPAARAVTEEQLDPEYIQNLIDYIQALDGAESIDKEELEGLNRELDAIFERLGL